MNNQLCDVDKFVEDINKAIEKYTKELDEAVDKISFKLGVNFIVTTALILAGVLATSAINIVKTVILETINDVRAAIISTFMAVMSVISGADLVFQYYQVKALRNKLTLRRTFLFYLKAEINKIIKFYEWYLNLSKLVNKDLFTNTDLDKALKYITGARNLLKAEALRISDAEQEIQQKAVNSNTVNSSRIYLLRAIDLLTKDSFNKSFTDLTKIENKLGINLRHPTLKVSTNPGDVFIQWNKYYEEVLTNLQKTYFVYSNPPGTKEHEAEKQQKFEAYLSVLTELVPAMPDILQGMFLQQTLGSASELLLSKIPVWTNYLTKIAKKVDNKTILDTSNLLKSDISSFGNQYRKVATPEFFLQADVKDLTLKKLSDNIKLIESGILSFASDWTQLLYIGNIQLNILKTSIANLATRIDNLNDLAGLSAELQKLKRISIASDLSNDVNYLAPLCSNNSNIKVGNTFTSGNELANLVEAGKLKIYNLQQYIKNKYFDYSTNSALTQPIDKAFNLAQKTLAPLLANVLVLTSPKTVKSLISYLQAIKILWEKQSSIDLVELELCNEYIMVMESNATFMTVKQQIDEHLNNLNQIPGFEDMANLLSEGALDTILEVVQGVETLNTLMQSGLCMESISTDVFIDPIMNALQNDPLYINEAKSKIAALQKDIKASINTLAEQKEIMLNQIDEIQNSILRYEESLTSNIQETIEGINFEETLNA